MMSAKEKATQGTEQRITDQLHGHMPTLDGLRGVAIILVMLFHYVTANHHVAVVEWTYAAARSGWIGVDLFFVLSGFLITGILLDTNKKPAYFRSFYVRRFLRIFPLYYGVLTLVFFVAPLINSLNTPGFQQVASIQIWLWSYLSNWATALQGDLIFVGDWVEANHFWSLAAEEQFYLIWPFIVYRRGPKQIAQLSLLIVAISFAVKAAFPWDSLVMKLFRADGLAVGAAVAALCRQVDARAVLVRAAPWLAALSTVCLAVIFVRGFGLHQDDPAVNRFGISAIQVLCAMTIVFLLTSHTKSFGNRLMTSRILTAFGRYSYGLYVFHWLLSPLMHRYLIPHMLGMEPTSNTVINAFLLLCQRVGLAFGVAYLSYNLFEKHFLKLKVHFKPES